MTPVRRRQRIDWFPPKSTQEATRRVLAGNPDTTWLGVVTAPDGTRTLRIADTSAVTASTLADINESHLCPPATDCPK